MSEMKFDHSTLVRVKENYITVSADGGGNVMMAASGDMTVVAGTIARLYETNVSVKVVMDQAFEVIKRPERKKGWTWRRVGLVILLIIFAVFAAIGIRESYLQDRLINHSQIPPYSVKDTAAKE